MKNIAYIPMVAMVLAAGAFTSCQEDMEEYDNKVFDSASPSEKVNTMFIKAGSPDQTKTLTASIAQPMDHDMTVVYRAAPELVQDYNSLYGESAVALPGIELHDRGSGCDHFTRSRYLHTGGSEVHEFR